jgi:hypothetical protein
MTVAGNSAARRASVFWRFYMLGWVALAGGAVSYLALAAAKPDFAAHISGEIQQTEAGETRAERARMVAELETLRDTVRTLEGELKRVESRVAAAEAPTQSTDLPQIQLRDEQPAQATGAPPDTQQAIADQKTAAATVPAAADKPAGKAIVVASSRIPPLPERGPVASRQPRVFEPEGRGVAAIVLNGGRDGRIVTGSIGNTDPPAQTRTASSTQARPATTTSARQQTAKLEPPTIRFGAATVKPEAVPAPPSAVVVSAASSLDGLRASWQQLSAQHPALLGTLEPRYDVMSSNGPYRLLAGPLTDRVEADRLCSALRVSGVTCGVGEFVGNAL